MDDDVFVYENTIEQLLAVLNSCGKGHAVSPIFCDSNTRELLTKYTKGFRGLVRNLIDFIIFGSFWGIAKMGSISQSGTPFYYDFNYLNKNLMLSSWLPGGMVICHKEDLLIKDYYPFKGKAYFEDVIHSILWRNMGIKLIVANVIVPTVVSKEKNTLKELVKEYRAKKYVVALLKHGMFHCRLSFFYSLIMYTAKQITLQIFGSKK
jgi:hypothetical protein